MENHTNNESTATGIHGNKEKNNLKKFEIIFLCKVIIVNSGNDDNTSIIERNFELFCKGISKIQKNTGEYFNRAQGGLYSSKKIGNIYKKKKKLGKRI